MVKKKKRGKSLEQNWPLTMTGYFKVHPKITYSFYTLFSEAGPPSTRISTVFHIYRQVLFGAGNQGNHHLAILYMLTNFYWDEAKKK